MIDVVKPAEAPGATPGQQGATPKGKESAGGLPLAEEIRKLIREEANSVRSEFDGRWKKVQEDLKPIWALRSDTKRERQAEAAPGAVTMDDVMAMRELGRIEATLPPELQTELSEAALAEGWSLKQQAAVARMLAAREAKSKTITEAPDATSGPQGATPAKPNTNRAGGPARREIAGLPSTQKEARAAMGDPKRRAELKTQPGYLDFIANWSRLPLK